MYCVLTLVLVGAVAYGAFKLGQESERYRTKRPVIRRRRKAVSQR